MTVTFFGRAVPAASPDFTLAAIPDTQHYVDSANYPTFTAQTQWIVANRNALNIAFVTHLGDITQNIDAVEQEWKRADTSMKVLDDAGIPYAVSPGNHDISAAGVAKFYDQYFPVSRFLPQPSYAGWLGQGTGRDRSTEQGQLRAVLGGIARLPRRAPGDGYPRLFARVGRQDSEALSESPGDHQHAHLSQRLGRAPDQSAVQVQWHVRRAGLAAAHRAELQRVPDRSTAITTANPGEPI